MNKTGTLFQRPRAALRALVLGALLIGPLAASAANVTGVYGTFGGFWTSNTSNADTSTRPNDSNLLLGFTVGSTTYSTGVNDAALTANNVTFNPQVFRALPVSDAPPPYPSDTYIGIARRWGGVEQTGAAGEVLANSDRPLSYYLTDGGQGLELGTAIFNLPPGTVLRVPIEGGDIQPEHVSDGIPDILVTQMGAIGTTVDRYQFFDATGQPVGASVNISLDGVSAVGNQDWTFYRAGPPPSNAPINSGGRSRAMRLVALHFSDFGITQDDLANVHELRQTMSGQADPAFFAYNANSVPVALPQLTLGKTVAPSPLVQGATGSYRLTVQNTSDRVATNGTIILTDTLPTGLTPTAASGTDWTCDIAGQVVNCNYSGVLATGASAPVVTIDVAVAGDAPASVTNTASVSGGGDADCPGADRCKASAIADVVPAPAPALALQLTPPATLAPGGSGSYTLTANNAAGTAPTSGQLSVSTTLPPGLTPTNASGDGWTCTIAGQTVTCTSDAVIPVGGSAPPITLEVNVAPDASRSVTVSANVQGGGDASCPADTRCQDSATTDLAAAPGPGAGGNVTAVPVMGLPGLLLLGAGLGLLGWRQRRRS